MRDQRAEKGHCRHHLGYPDIGAGDVKAVGAQPFNKEAAEPVPSGVQKENLTFVLAVLA